MPSPSAPKKTRPFRWLPYVGAAGLVVLLALGLRPRPAPVETARAIIGPLSATVSEEGKTRIKQRYVVSSPVAGLLRRIPFKPGADVIRGETVVAVIDPAPASPLDERNRVLAEVRRRSAAELLSKSRTTHELAQSELQRIERMFAAKIVSPQDLDNAQMRETAAARDLAAAEGALREAEAQLQLFYGQSAETNPVEVKATASGRVLTVFQESSRVVAQGTPLIEIGDPADLEVVIQLLSRDGAALAPGTRAVLEQWGGPQPLEARVRLIEPAAFTKISALGVEEQRVNVVADITTPLAERQTLGDNFRVEARVIVWENDRVLKVPVSALFRRGSNWAAYVVRDGRAVLMPVSAGRSSGTETQVIDGLKEGEEVILYPGDRVAGGQRVQPIKVVE